VAGNFKTCTYQAKRRYSKKQEKAPAIKDPASVLSLAI